MCSFLYYFRYNGNVRLPALPKNYGDEKLNKSLMLKSVMLLFYPWDLVVLLEYISILTGTIVLIGHINLAGAKSMICPTTPPGRDLNYANFNCATC